MDVLDLFFKKYSYKFPKGYPDMNNEQDILLLHEILTKMNIPLYESIKVNESSSDIKDTLIDAGYAPEDIIIKSSKQIRLLTKGNERKSTIDNLVKDLGYTYDPNFKGSSLGAVMANDGVAIIVKPKERQGGLAAGLDNEQILVDNINQYIEEDPIKIIFEGNNKTISFDNITKAKSVGTDTAGGKKSDVALYSNDEIVGNLSLKKANASMWESADKRYKSLINKLSQKLIDNPFPNLGLRKTEKKDIYRLYNPKTNIDLSGIIITNLPSNENESIIFGTDNPKVQVIKHTFQPSDFSLSNGVLTIKSGIIFTDLSDIEGTEYEPILIIRHDSTRTASKGLRPVVYNKNFAYKGDNVKGSQVELTYDQAIS
jgi:hypothetical protein